MAYSKTNISIHFDPTEIPTVSIDHFNDPVAFQCFKIKTSASEINYFFTDELQLSDFKQNLLNAINDITLGDL